MPSTSNDSPNSVAMMAMTFRVILVIGSIYASQTIASGPKWTAPQSVPF